MTRRGNFRAIISFNLQKLLDIAVNAADDGAQSCSPFDNDNGKEVFAKLPNPNAGPARYVTASEVATREFLGEVVNLPVPRAFAWSCDPANPVGAEYIIEEKAPGTRLGSIWHQWPRESKLCVIEQIADIEHALTTIKFSKHGCLYFKEDLPNSFREENDTLLVEPSGQSACLDRYAIGPLSSADLLV
ncbi:uncharacterized protein CIMG_12902 [Coccidioides immitis RS]|uniref:Phosphotransferase enzyme family protein n=1 Tax=Coccidioides immitis (strain RS) TaxID=246410 RepID=A0A0D8JSP5_COCIM|nr:uncharacterized protein CIMG_12902 [Coccidioides immitis RS]KJF60370.1 hypothetical protein CIMG_12902 [Coccidioides immitis RS]